MDAEVRPATPENDLPMGNAFDHPFIVPASDSAPNLEAATQLPNAEQASTLHSTSNTPLLLEPSAHMSHNGIRNSLGDLGAGGSGERQPNVTERTDSGTRRSDSSFSGNVTRGDSLNEQEVAVLTPSRLRLDSRVVMAHATLQWLTNAVWAVLIWQKMDGRIHCSWWAVFSPTIINHVLHIPLQLLVLKLAHYMVHKQIGPPPPPSATPGLVLQYTMMHAVRVKSHRVDWVNNSLESVAVFIVKLLFCNALNHGKLKDTPLRLMFTPIWCCWVITFVLVCFKDRTERMFGSSRDLFFIFLLFVAFKVDEQSSYSWRVVFLVPWMWFSGLMLVAAMVTLLLIFAKVWARPRELLLPTAFLLLLLSSIPQFMSYIALVRRLDGDVGTSFGSILGPNALSWLLMWMSAGAISVALMQKEAARDALLARGAVWTAYEGVARGLTAVDETQRRVDDMSNEEVSRLVESMMAGKSKPGRLQRVGDYLYKRIASLEPALTDQAVAAVQLTTAVTNPGSSPPSRSTSIITPPPANPAANAAANPNGVTCGSEPLGGVEPLLPTCGPSGIGALAAPPSIGPSSVVATGGSVSGCVSGDSGSGGIRRYRNNRVVPAPPARFVNGREAAAGRARAGRAGTGVEGSFAGAADGGATAAPAAVAEPPFDASSGSIEDVAGFAAQPQFSSRGTAEAEAVMQPSNLAPKPQQRDVDSCETADDSCSPSASIGPDLRHKAHHQAPENPGQPPGAGFPTGVESTADVLADTAASACHQKQSRLAPLPPWSPCLRSATAHAAATSATRPSAIPASGSTMGPNGKGPESQRPCSAVVPRAGTSPLVPGEASAYVVAPSSTTSGRAAVESVDTKVRQAPALIGDPPADATTHHPKEASAVAGGKRLAAITATESAPAELQRPASAAARVPGGAALRASLTPSGIRSCTGDEPPSLSASGSLDHRSPAELPAAEVEMAPQGASGRVEAVAVTMNTSSVDAEVTSAPPAVPMAQELPYRCLANLLASHTPQPEASASGGGATSCGEDEGECGGSGGVEGDRTGSAVATVGTTTAASEADPENTCVICYDGEATCVFLECGHGGFCRQCAFRLFVRPPNECPTCRTRIDQVVEIEAVTAVGEVAKVK